VTHNFADNLKYTFGTIKSSFIPAFFIAVALIMFYAQNPFEFQLSQIFHAVFLGISAFTAVFLYITNQTKPFFSLLQGIIVYALINWFKKEYSTDFALQPYYILLCFAVPVNMIIFYFLPPQQLRSLRGFCVTIALLIEMAIIEHFNRWILLIPYIDITWESMPLWCVLLWLVCLTILAINISFKNTIINTGLFYADSALFLCLAYAHQASAHSIFGLAFTAIIFCITLLDLFYRYHHDSLEKVSSYNSYISRAGNKFLFKYTVAVFCIDNREKLLSSIGEANIQVLEQMLVNKICEFSPEVELFRYNENELMMVFKNEDAKHALEYCENIRRTIAASEFIFTSGKTLKITISICVSERTRKYIDADVVAERGHNGLQKGYHFNSNIATIAS
jgi:GGDEF domain-containing protein